MTDRDPRVAPVAGDELLYEGFEPYRVVRVEGRWIVDTPISEDNLDYGQDLYHDQKEWEAFYRTAVVIRTAEQSETK